MRNEISPFDNVYIWSINPLGMYFNLLCFDVMYLIKVLMIPKGCKCTANVARNANVHKLAQVLNDLPQACMYCNTAYARKYGAYRQWHLSPCGPALEISRHVIITF